MKQRLTLLAISMLVVASFALSKDRKRAVELNNLATRCIQEQHFDSALVLFDRAIRADSTFFSAYAQKCNVLWVLQRDTEALYTARQLTGVKSSSADAFALEGMAYEHTGRRAKARESYTKSLALLSASMKLDTASWLVRSQIANLLTIVKGRSYGLEEIERLLAQRRGSLSSVALETLAMQKNEIHSYQGGGMLEFIASGPSHSYWFKTTRTPEEIQRYFLDRGVNVHGLTARPEGYMLEIKDKFRTRARELGLTDSPERPDGE